jgi:hypothetical protein
MSRWIDKAKDFIMGHPDAPDAGHLPESGETETAPGQTSEPESAPTSTPDVSDLPTDPGDAGAIPRDPEPEPGLDEVTVTDDPVSAQQS